MFNRSIVSMGILSCCLLLVTQFLFLALVEEALLLVPRCRFLPLPCALILIHTPCHFSSFFSAPPPPPSLYVYSFICWWLIPHYRDRSTDKHNVLGNTQYALPTLPRLTVVASLAGPIGDRRGRDEDGAAV